MATPNFDGCGSLDDVQDALSGVPGGQVFESMTPGGTRIYMTAADVRKRVDGIAAMVASLDDGRALDGVRESGSSWRVSENRMAAAMDRHREGSGVKQIEAAIRMLPAAHGLQEAVTGAVVAQLEFTPPAIEDGVDDEDDGSIIEGNYRVIRH